MTTLLCWVAGIIVGAPVLAAVAWVATRGLRARRRAEEAARLDVIRRRQLTEADAREARKAEIAAEAQVRAMAPLVAAVVAAIRAPEPPPRPEPVKVRAEVIRRG